MAKAYKEHIVACIDLLGFREALESENDDDRIELMLQHFRDSEREQKISLNSDGGTHEMILDPKISAQSDQLKISITEKDIPKPFDISSAIFTFIEAISQITISALMHGFLIRGGIMRGKLYSFNDVSFDFDLTYADAYKLEQLAGLPMVILPVKGLGEFASSPQLEFMMRIKINDTYYFWIDFLKYAFIFGKYSQDALEKLVIDARKITQENINKFELGSKPLIKWLWFEEYLERSINTYYEPTKI